MDLLKSPIKKLYRSYLVPSLSAAVVTSVYGFVDTIAIGQGVGPDGAAALAIAQPIFGVVSFFGLLCGIGGSVYLGKARGKQKMEKSNAYFFASLCLAVALTLIAWITFTVFSTPIYTFFGATPPIDALCAGLYKLHCLDYAIFHSVSVSFLHSTQRWRPQSSDGSSGDWRRIQYFWRLVLCIPYELGNDRRSIGYRTWYCTPIYYTV